MPLVATTPILADAHGVAWIATVGKPEEYANRVQYLPL